MELRQEVATLRQERDGLQKVLQALLVTCTCQNKMAANVQPSHQLTSLKQMSSIHNHNPQTIHTAPDTESPTSYPAALVQTIQHLTSTIQHSTPTINHPTPNSSQVEPNELFTPKDYQPSCIDQKSSSGKRSVFASSITQIYPGVQGPSVVLITDTGKPSLPRLCQLSPGKPSYPQLSSDKPSYPKLCQLLNSQPPLLALPPGSYSPDSHFLKDPATSTSQELSRDFRHASVSSDGSYHEDAFSLQQFRSLEVPELDMDDVFTGGAPVYDVNNNVPFVADTNPAGDGEGLAGEEDVLQYISEDTVTLEDVGSFFNQISGGEFGLGGSADFSNGYSSF